MRVAAIVTACALVPLLAPTVLVVTASLSPGEVLTFPPQGVTTRWYTEMFTSDAVWTALGNSLFVAGLSVLINVVCGVPAALALPHVGRYARTSFTVLLSLGLSSPTIVTAFAYFDLYGRIGLRGSLTAVAIAVAVTCFPFMLWTVLAAIEDTNPDLGPAAATLGADPVEQFLFVRLPLLAPGIVTGALVVFVLSITDFVVSQVLTTIDNQTLPVFVYSGLRGAISPALGAVSAFFIAVVALAFAVVLRLGRVERFLFRT
ncbi:ABC transporter permease [Mycobacterium yunnanensis]|uniref:ABC transporter permease n=1 Tax=Mycobacterium yunnanensis TaxID=368477 RepID=A0A9X2Z9B8_9MYCO|nr:ABC transporter permease [Mycobacterium yunnanensis]MCV7424516.1 ABC transporter permease [Mycobacterium yunnanensis]